MGKYMKDAFWYWLIITQDNNKKNRNKDYFKILLVVHVWEGGCSCLYLVKIATCDCQDDPIRI